MTDANLETSLNAGISADIDVNIDAGALNGFRLQQFAVLNWGTFDQKIWQLNPRQ